MATLIVNADDFGLSESVNRGIADAFTDGIVTSTTWLAGGEAAEDAVAIGCAIPQLEVGLHLALSTVQPVGDISPFNHQLDADHRWPSGFWPVLRWMRTTKDAQMLVHAEWRAQILRFLNRWNRLPSHLDSHQHIALLPGLPQVLVELARDFGIPAIRVPSELRRVSDLAAPSALYRLHETLVISYLSSRLRTRALRAGVGAPVSFAGFRQSGRLDEPTLLALIPRLSSRNGTIELMVHPGLKNEPGGYQRRTERDALLSERVQEILNDSGLRLGRFSDLS